MMITLGSFMAEDCDIQGSLQHHFQYSTFCFVGTTITDDSENVWTGAPISFCGSL
jgi:hypothetical protein